MRFVPTGRLIAILCSVFLLSHCTTYHFEYPLPVNEPNVNAFPKTFRGVWYDDEKGLPRFQIDKYSISIMTVDEQVKIYRGLIDTAAARKGKHGLSHLNYNPSTQKLDTIIDYIIKGKEIYKKDGKELYVGASYSQSGDSLILNYDIEKMNRICRFRIDDDDNNFLRKISNNQYIFNFQERNLLSLYDNPRPGWYQIFLLELTKDGRLYITSFTDGPEAAKIIETENEVYLNASGIYAKYEAISPKIGLSRAGSFISKATKE